MRRINFGIRLPVTGPYASAENIIKIGTTADELGFNAITTHDHVSSLKSQMYHISAGSSELVDERARKGLSVTDIYESIAALSVLAGKTSNVRLIPSALILPWRYPILLAKQAITLQELSGGRFVCAVVTGDVENDFKAMNVNYKARGKIMDEYLEVLKLMLSAETGRGGAAINFSGKYIEIPSLEFNPRPSRKIPIWIGGSFIERAFERVAKFGDGYIPSVHGVPSFYREGVPRLRSYLKRNGRDFDQIELGAQPFICLMKDGAEARRRSRYTLESFFQSPIFDVPDPSDHTKTRREVLLKGIREGSLVGSPDDVAKKIEEHSSLGTNFFELRLLNRTFDDLLEMMKLFAKEVMPSFR